MREPLCLLTLTVRDKVGSPAVSVETVCVCVCWRWGACGDREGEEVVPGREGR